MQIAVREISTFLLENEMRIYLVVFGKEAFELSEKLFKSVSSYIDEHYICRKTLDEYGTESEYGSHLKTRRIRERLKRSNRIHEDICPPQALKRCFDMPAGAAAPMGPDDWGQLLKDLDAGFSETLLQLIDRTGKTLKFIKKLMWTENYFQKSEIIKITSHPRQPHWLSPLHWNWTLMKQETLLVGRGLPSPTAVSLM